MILLSSLSPRHIFNTLYYTIHYQRIELYIPPYSTTLIIFTFFFFNDPAPPEIYPLSLPDPLPIFGPVEIDVHLHRDAVGEAAGPDRRVRAVNESHRPATPPSQGLRRERGGAQPMERLLRVQRFGTRSEEHTSELQSRLHLVCRLLL